MAFSSPSVLIRLIVLVVCSTVMDADDDDDDSIRDTSEDMPIALFILSSPIVRDWQESVFFNFNVDLNRNPYEIAQRDMFRVGHDNAHVAGVIYANKKHRK